MTASGRDLPVVAKIQMSLSSLFATLERPSTGIRSSPAAPVEPGSTVSTPAGDRLAHALEHRQKHEQRAKHPVQCPHVGGGLERRQYPGCKCRVARHDHEVGQAQGQTDDQVLQRQGLVEVQELRHDRQQEYRALGTI